MNFIKNSSKLQFCENADENSIYMWFVCHLTLSALWHVYSFAYDRFSWCDGIRYSYILFCAKSASISLVDFSVDIVVSNTCFQWKFKIELKFICAYFQILSTFSKHNIAILVSISHGNRSLTSYSLGSPEVCLGYRSQGLYSPSAKTSYSKIAWSLEPRDWILQWLYRSEIWQACRQLCCGGACRI